MEWFRFYSAALDDPKVQRLPAELFKVWVNLLCLANQGDVRGQLPAREDIAFRLRLSEAETDAALDALIARGLLDEVDGALTPHNWGGRQPKSDNVTERVQRHRAKRYASETTTAGETLPQRFSNALDTDTDTENISAADAPPQAETPEPVVAVAVAARRRDELFEAVAEVCYGGWEQITPTERGLVNRALKELRAIRAGPADVRQRGARYRELVARGAIDYELTPQTLLKKWSFLSARPPAAVAAGRALERMETDDGQEFWVGRRARA